MLLNRSIQPKTGGEQGPKGDTGLPALMYIGPALMTEGSTVNVDDTVTIANIMFNRTPLQYEEFITVLKNGTGDTDISKMCLLQCTSVDGTNGTYKIIFAQDNTTGGGGSTDTSVKYLVSAMIIDDTDDNKKSYINIANVVYFGSEEAAQNIIQGFQQSSSSATGMFLLLPGMLGTSNGTVPANEQYLFTPICSGILTTSTEKKTIVSLQSLSAMPPNNIIVRVYNDTTNTFETETITVVDTMQIKITFVKL